MGPEALQIQPYQRAYLEMLDCDRFMMARPFPEIVAVIDDFLPIPSAATLDAYHADALWEAIKPSIVTLSEFAVREPDGTLTFKPLV